MTDALRAFLDEARGSVDRELARLLADPAGPSASDDPGRLREAMRYAVLGGGKRLRPALVVAAAHAVGGDAGARAALPAGAAVELLHAYTLVHDDLPAMDDDALRRGRPTVHVAFGEAVAILAGDALLTLSFAALAALGPLAGDAVTILATRAGAFGLIAGQCRDLESAGAAPLSLSTLERVHAEKTGALFAAAAELGALAAGGHAEARRAMADYGLQLGIAFQHADDLADGDQPQHAAQARVRVAELVAGATRAIAGFGPAAQPLIDLAASIRDGG